MPISREGGGQSFIGSAMIYGLYLSAQGAEAQATRLDVLSNNLANASTSAFKRDLALFQAHQPFDVEQGNVDVLPDGCHLCSGGVSLAGTVTDYSNGPLTQTGGTYDVALAGPGFLVVNDGTQQHLTRNGKFAVDDQGTLVTQDTGLPVISADGAPIAIPAEAASIEITDTGRIFRVDNGTKSEIDRLAVVEPESLNDLQKVGNSFYISNTPVRPAGPGVRVMQGHLEGSGTNSITEMLHLIEAGRGFETNINLIRSQDEALGQLLQSVGRR